MAAPAFTNWPSVMASTFVGSTLLWILFLMFESQKRPNAPSFKATLGMGCHAIPSLALLATTTIAKQSQDEPLVWFCALLLFRYWRTLVSIFFWFQYKPAVDTGNPTMTAADCTVVVPTVGFANNSVYSEMITAILVNHPALLIFSTNTDAAAKQVSAALPALVAEIKAGFTSYQIQHRLGPFTPETEILVLNARVSNKRRQVVQSFRKVKTKILVMVDDTAIWQPTFLKASLPAFESDKVGLVGTRKWVKRLPRPHDPKASIITNLSNQYIAGFWNTIGALYLIRHNFEIRATNAADGGVFCVSGRSSLIRTEIVNNAAFTEAFLNEYILQFNGYFSGWGPLAADDDNFVTRWVLNNGWVVKIQSSQEATMNTVLGTYPLKFPEQCKRWSRTTFRQNPIALFIDRTIWWKWPWTVWTTYLPWLYNAALIWDGLAVYALAQSNLYCKCMHPTVMLFGLISFMWATKLVKTIPWFWAYPVDFFLYFVIPAYPAFIYWHSLLKICTGLTLGNIAWSGRRLE